jgi:uncharacterized protein YkwD
MRRKLPKVVGLIAFLCVLVLATGCARNRPPAPPPPPPPPVVPPPPPPPPTPTPPAATPTPTATTPGGGGTTPTPTPTGGTNPTPSPTPTTTATPTPTPTATTPPTGGTEPETPPPAFGRTEFELKMDESILAELNRRRAARGVPPVRLHNALVKTAAEHSIDEMNRNYFSSTNPEGQTLQSRANANGIPGPVSSIVGKNTENPATNPKDAPGMGIFMLNVYEGQPTNQAKLYDPAYNRVGIGSAYRNVPAYPPGKTTYNTISFGKTNP